MKRIASLLVLAFILASVLALSGCDLLSKFNEDSTDGVSDENQNETNDTENNQGDPSDDKNDVSEVGGALYSVSSDKTYCVLTGVKDGTSAIVVIPDNVSGVPITVIGESAFASAVELEEIVIPESITSIGNDAFGSCAALESIFYLGSGEQLAELMSNVGDGNSYFTSAKVYMYSELEPEMEGDFWHYVEGAPAVWPEYVAQKELAFDFVDGDDPYYVVIGIGTYDSSDVVIPSTYNGYPVREIGENAFYELATLTSVSIPDSVTDIGAMAFGKCTGLASITVAEANEAYVSIEGNLYTNDGALLIKYATGKTDPAFVIPNYVTDIGKYAFSYSVSLESVIVTENVKSIDEAAFCGCTKLESVYYKGIESAWNDITVVSTENEPLIKATRYYYSESEPTVKGNFWHYVNDAITVWPEYVAPLYSQGLEFTSYGNGTCYVSGIGACTDENVVIPPTSPSGDSVIAIGSGAFKSCKTVTSVKIPDSVTSIKANAFSYCIYLTSVNIPCNVTSIGDGAFYECRGLTELYYDARSIDTFTSSNTIFRNAGKDSNGITVSIGAEVVKIPSYFLCPSDVSYAPGSPPNVVKMAFDEGSVCESIGKYAFYNCLRLTNAIIPENVTSIGDYAFANCRSISDVQFNAKVLNAFTTKSSVFSYAGESGNGIVVNIGSGVTQIPDYLFYNGSGENYVIAVNFEEGSSCESIGKYAFNNCKKLKSLTVSESVKSIGTKAFYNCESLMEINFNAIELDPLSTQSEHFYASYKNDITVNVGAKVTKIPDYLFYKVSKIKTVTFAQESALKSIGDRAFQGCESLCDITIPYGLTSIGAYAFDACRNISGITIPSGVAVIGDRAFYACSSLAQIIVSEENAVYRSIDGNLYTKDGKTLVQYATGKSDAAFVVPDGVVSIGGYAFANCTNLTSVVISDGITTIEPYAFYCSTGLVSVSIGETVTSIGKYAFSQCKNLKSVTVPDSITRIEPYTFHQSTSLESLTIGENVTSIGQYAFANCTSLISITIPDNTTTVESCAFYSCTGATTLTIGEGVTTIGSGAFSVCKNITEIYYNAKSVNGYLRDPFYTIGQNGDGVSVYIGAAVTKIPSDLFYVSRDNADIVKVVTVTFAEGSVCESIGSSAFRGCTALKSVTIPENVTSIGKYAFYDCRSLVEINYNARSLNALSIDSNLFYKAGRNGVGITVNIGDRVTKIPDYLFYISSFESEPNIVNVTFEEGSVCQSVGTYAFYSCRALASVTIGERVADIGDMAFAYCTSLNNLAIPDSVINIGESAFYNCSALTSVIIGSGVENICNRAFGSCTRLENINVVSGNESYSSIEGNLYTKDGKTLVQYAFGKKDSAFVIPEDVTGIAFAAFEYCNDLMSIIISDSVTEIGDRAFYSCDKLASVVIGDGVISVGEYAFYYCDNLQSVVIGESVESIGKHAFYNCTDLTEIVYNAKAMNPLEQDSLIFYNAGKSSTGINVTIGAGVTRIPDGLFYTSYETLRPTYAPNVITVTFAEGSACKSIGAAAFLDCIYLTSINLPDSVTYIGSGAFYGCESLTSINIPYGVKFIGTSTFRNCASLTSVTIPDSVTVIHEGAFSFCYSLTDIIIPNSVTKIYDSAFIYCESLVSVTIPSGAVSIDNNVFQNCTSLVDIIVSEENPMYRSIDGNFYTKDGKTLIFYAIGKPEESFSIPDGVTAIGEYAFSHSVFLKTVLIPESVTSIGDYAFEHSAALSSMVIPGTVTKIGDSAFYYCKSLESVTVCEGIRTISRTMFWACSSLTNVILPTTLTGIEASAFEECTSLTSIVIPESVKRVANYAFDDCTALKNVYYVGTEAQWSEITIGYKNDYLKKAAKTYSYKPE